MLLLRHCGAMRALFLYNMWITLVLCVAKHPKTQRYGISSQCVRSLCHKDFVTEEVLRLSDLYSFDPSFSKSREYIFGRHFTAAPSVFVFDDSTNELEFMAGCVWPPLQSEKEAEINQEIIILELHIINTKGLAKRTSESDTQMSEHKQTINKHTRMGFTMGVWVALMTGYLFSDGKPTVALLTTPFDNFYGKYIFVDQNTGAICIGTQHQLWSEDKVFRW